MNVNDTMVNQGDPLPPGRGSKKGTSSNDSNSDSPKSSNVKVVVRVRPTNAMESQGNHTNVVRAMDDRVVVFDPHDDIDTNSFIPNKMELRRSNIMGRRVKDLRFIFDRVFDEKSSNQDIFNHTTKTIIDGVLDGYNCTVFAYGATGAGKTHTMLGNGEMPGVMFLTMMDLYNRIDEMKSEKTCEVAVSYLEVYNETIRDLLLPGKSLAVREDPQRGVCVSGLTLHQPRSAEELFGMLEYGNQNRSQHPTDANATSSRSHAVFQVFVRLKSKACGLKANIQCAKMSLIDLAGSERATATKNRGARFREGANINKSLLALGNCINALAENPGKNFHIPYRNSKLTRILKDSLGGNCRTVMIAAVSPSSLSYEDTYNTLKYADRAKSIKSSLVKNIVSVDLHVSRYAKLVKELQSEVVCLKEKLKRFETGEATPLRRNLSQTRKNDETKKLKSEIKTVFGEKSNIKKNLIDTQCLEKELTEKLYRKQKNAEWMNLLCNEENKTDKVETRVRKCLSATKSRLKHLKERKDKLNKQLQQNEEWLKRTQDEIKIFENEDSNGGTSETESYFTVYQASCSYELKSNELQQECKYYKKSIQNYEAQRKREKRLIETLLKFVKKQFVVLKLSGMATNEMTEDYDTIVNIIEDNREVAWADQTVQKNTKPLDVTEIVDNNLSIVTGESSQTPKRTPLRPNLSNYSTIDFTPGRVKIPTLTLTSTLSGSKISPAHFISPFIPAPLPRSTATQRRFDDKTTSESSVRQNLLNVLDQDGSTSVTCDLSSTNSESRTLSVTPAFQFNAPKISGPVEKKELCRSASLNVVGSNLQTDSVIMSSKPTTFGKGKRPYPKQTASGSAKRNMAPPLGEQNNSLNIKASTNQPSSIHPGILRQRPISSLGGNENGKKIPSYASLTKSAAQKITSKDMLPKRSHPKENNQPQPKRSKPQRSISSSGFLNDYSMKRQQHHISGLKRAVSVLNIRK